MNKYIKTALLAAGGILLAAQLYRPARNQSNEHPGDIFATYPAPEAVQQIVKTSCYDCHSNNTVYPWYANIQPVAFWLANHVEEGKGELNFAAFAQRRIAVQNHKLEEIIEQVEANEMPLSSYTWIHRDAILDATQKKALTDWAKQTMDTIKAHYPADSLILRKKPAAAEPTK